MQGPPSPNTPRANANPACTGLLRLVNEGFNVASSCQRSP